VDGDALALLGGEDGQHREDAAEGDRDVVYVVHGADCFPGKWQRGSPCEASFYAVETGSREQEIGSRGGGV